LTVDKISISAFRRLCSMYMSSFLMLPLSPVLSKVNRVHASSSEACWMRYSGALTNTVNIDKWKISEGTWQTFFASCSVIRSSLSLSTLKLICAIGYTEWETRARMLTRQVRLTRCQAIEVGRQRAFHSRAVNSCYQIYTQKEFRFRVDRHRLTP